MTYTEEPGTGSPAGLLRGFEAVSLSCRDAATVLVSALERAGAPWSFVPADALAGHDLLPEGSRRWPLVLPGAEVLGFVLREPGRSAHDELITVLLSMVSSLAAAEQALADAASRAAVAERQARIDPMTGLLNRRAWEDAIAAEAARMRRHETVAAVVVVDIDGLKETNDVAGHLTGDLLIRRAAAAIRGAVRDEDVVARTGGDEFAVLAVEADAPLPDSVLGRIRATLAEVAVAASAGASVARGPDGSLEEAVKRADAAMYLEKRAHRLTRRREHQPPGS